jgi:hypothetical protein
MKHVPTALVLCVLGLGCTDTPEGRSVPTAPQTAVASADAPREGSVEIFLQGHQDDWQLFLGDRVADAVLTARKVVFVYMTAGDAGSTTDYWQAREVAAQASIDAITPPGSWTCAAEDIGGHAIRRCTKANTVSYYLRLPDGNGEGQGYFGRGSLAQLRSAGRTLTALDGSAMYPSWADLTSTVGGMIALESAGTPEPLVAVHAPDWEVMRNGGDHSDHIATGDAVRELSWGHAWNHYWYIDYQNLFEPINVTGDRLAVKWSTIVAYDDVVRGNYGTILGQRAEEWAARTIFRSEPSTELPLPRPAAVSGLSATVIDGTQIDLRWDDTFTVEEGFRVERAPDINGAPGGFQFNVSLPANTTAWPSTGLVENTRYWYRVRAFDAAGSSAYSAEVSAVTRGTCVPPSFTSGPSSATGTVNGSITLTATAIGAVPLRYEWRHNGVVIPGATAATHTLAPLMTSDAGAYDLVATNECGAATSAPAIVTVSRASAVVELSAPAATYDGSPKHAVFSTTPAGLAVTVVYTTSGSAVAAPINAGEYSVTATITDANYEGTASATMTIAKATPIVAWGSPAAITYGTPLGSGQLNATASTVGTFVYTPGSGTLLSGGTHTLSVTFAPTDAGNFASASATTTIGIGKRTPTIGWTPADVTVPSALGAAQLNAVAYAADGTTPVSGTYAYTSNGIAVTTGTVLPPGINTPLTVVFTPTGAAANNFTSATRTITTFNVLNKIDITPGSTSNAVSLAGTQKEIIVGVVSTANFDARAMLVSGSTPTLGNGAGSETPVVMTNGIPKKGLTDLNADGRLDVLFYFAKAALISNGDLTASTTQLILQGQLPSGVKLKGADKVSVLP